MNITTNDHISPNIIRQLLMLALVIGLGYLLYSQLAFLVSAFLGAIALYMIMRKPMFKMIYEWKVKKWVATLILIIISLVVIVLPFALIIDVLIRKLVPLLADPSGIMRVINQIDQFFNEKFDFKLLSRANLDKLPALLTNVGTKILGGTLSMLINVIVMYFILWFMLMKNSEMERNVRRNLPLKNTNTNKLLHEVRAIVVSNAIGIPVLGLCQGVLAIIGYYIFNVEQPILWGIITGIASVVPFVGTTIVWVPIAVLAFANGETNNGYWLLIWGAVVIGSSDNIIRFILQKFLADIHPLITVFGVVVGLNLFGFLGLIFGPLLLSLFLLLMRIYFDEFIKPTPVELITEDDDKKEKS